MNRRLILVTPAATAATRLSRFATDDPLDEAARVAVARLRLGVHPRTAVITAPTVACVQTAAGAGLDATIEPAVRDWDLGRWRGQVLTDVNEDQLAQWIAEPASAPHGGESLTALIDRVQLWLDAVPAGRTVAIVSTAVARAAIVSALAAGPELFWRLDLAPLTAAALSGRSGRWNLQSSGQHVCSVPALTRRVSG